MKKIFIKTKEKYHIKRYSIKYYIAVFIELVGITFFSLGLYEIYIKCKINPANFLINLGGLFFTIGSFIYTKYIKH